MNDLERPSWKQMGQFLWRDKQIVFVIVVFFFIIPLVTAVLHLTK